MSSHMIDKINRIKSTSDVYEIAKAIDDLVVVATSIAFTSYKLSLSYDEYIDITMLEIPLNLRHILIDAFYAIELSGFGISIDSRIVSVGLEKRQTTIRARKTLLDELRRYGIITDRIRLRRIKPCERSHVYGVYEIVEEVDKPDEYMAKIRYYLHYIRPFTVELRKIRINGKLKHSIKLLES